DETRVIVRLHLEHRHPAVADVDHAGVLTRALDDVRAGGRELAQVDLRGLVGTVLGPERRGDAELGVARIPAEEAAQTGVLLRREAALGAALVRSARAPAFKRPENSARPSLLPSTASAARSGCGISPSTLPRSL